MNVLVIAPHPDDEVLGVGGTIAKHSMQGDDVYICIVTKFVLPTVPAEIVERGRRECKIANKKLGAKEVIFLDYPANMLHEVPICQIADDIGEIIKRYCIDVVYIPDRGDVHQDHKIVFDAAMVAVRPKGDMYPRKVMSYEVLSETGWDAPFKENVFSPNVYVDITGTLDNKLEALAVYSSQVHDFPDARSLKAVESLAVYRGTTVSNQAAEAFSLIREVN